MVIGIIAVISAVALPSLVRARMTSNEASAFGSLRAVNSGQNAFRFVCGGGRYSTTLQNLSMPVHGRSGFISEDLGVVAPVKSGYQFDLATVNPTQHTSCNGGVTGETYHATGEPLPSRGRRSFGTNGSGTIYESGQPLVGVMPDVGSPPPPATPLK